MIHKYSHFFLTIQKNRTEIRRTLIRILNYLCGPNSDTMANDLTKGSPARVIFVYSLPIILGNVFQQVYNLVDTVIVGRLVNYQALAGVGITNGLTFLVMGFVFGITGGLGIKIAQYFGAQDWAGLRRSVGTSLIISTVLAVLLTVTAVTCTEPMLRLIGTGPEIFPYSRDYLIILFAGISTQTAYNLISCILRGLGDSRTPLYFLIFSSLLNVGLDILFIGGLRWGVKGAAFGTVISQATSAVLCFIYAFRHYKVIRISRGDLQTSRAFVWEHLRIGIPMALQFSITAVGIVMLQAALNSFPPTYIAGFSAASKIQSIGSLVAISFGVAIANYAGQNYGAGDIRRVRRGVTVTVMMTLSVCLVASVLMATLATPLTSLFLDPGTAANGEIYEASRRYLYTSATFFPFLYLIFVYRNALQGIGKTFLPLMAGVLELVIRAVGSHTLPHMFGYPGVPMVDVSAWIGACVMLFISYRIQMPKPDSVPDIKKV